MIPGCTYEEAVYGPHPGCREFTPEPEAILVCGDPAVAAVVLRTVEPDDDYRRWVEVVAVEYACPVHAPVLAEGLDALGLYGRIIATAGLGDVPIQLALAGAR